MSETYYSAHRETLKIKARARYKQRKIAMDAQVRGMILKRYENELKQARETGESIRIESKFKYHKCKSCNRYAEQRYETFIIPQGERALRITCEGCQDCEWSILTP